MVCALYKSVFAMMAALSVSSTDALCTSYAPWFHATVNEEVLSGDLKLIGQYFSCFRTFETMMGGVNIIDVAAKSGLKVAVGVQMNDLTKVDAEIKAVCDGYNRHPEAVETIYVGNENVMINGFGTVSVEQLVLYIQQVKQCTNNSVHVGTVQRITEWASTGNIKQLADASDIIGCNIYPYFSVIKTTAIAEFKAQWELMASKYDITKVQVTETGWPSGGSAFQGNQPSLASMQQYLNDFAEWSMDKGDAYWFQSFDQTLSYSGADYEMHFGIFTVDGTLKVTIPAGSHGVSGQIPTSNSTTPAPSMPPVNGSSSPVTPTPAVNTPVTYPTNSPATQSPTPVNGSPTPSTPVNGTTVVYNPSGNSNAGDVGQSPIPVNGSPAPSSGGDETPVDYTPTDNSPAGNVAQSPIPVNGSPAPSTPADGTTVVYPPTNNSPAGNVAQSPIPVNGSPAPSSGGDETPVDYTPTNNSPAGNVAQSPIPIVPTSGNPPSSPSTPSTTEPDLPIPSGDNCAM